MDNSKGVGGIIPSTTAIDFFKKIPKLVKDNLLFGNENGNPSYLDAAQGNERNGQTRLLS